MFLFLQELVDEEQPSSYTAPGAQQTAPEGEDDHEQWKRGGEQKVDQDPGRRVGETIRRKIEEGWQFLVAGHR